MEVSTLNWVIKYLAVFLLLTFTEVTLIWNTLSGLRSGRKPGRTKLFALWIILFLMIACIFVFAFKAPRELFAGTNRADNTTIEASLNTEPMRLPAPVMIPTLFLVTLAALFFLRRVSNKNGEARGQECAISGVVTPRKIGIYNCSLEIAVTAFLLISIPFHIIQLTAYSAFIAIIFWAIRISIQNTTLLYENDTITYCTLTSCRTYHISEIDHFSFVPIRQGGMQLRIYIKGRGLITLEERNYLGLTSLAEWISSAGEL